jgi:hypothetical protein
MKRHGEANPMAWQAEATVMERLHPETFGKRESVNLTQTNRKVNEITIRVHMLDGEALKNRELHTLPAGGDDLPVLDTQWVDSREIVEEEA